MTSIPSAQISVPIDMASEEEQSFAWRRGVVLRLAARVHGRLLVTVYLVWVCHRLFTPSIQDLFTPFFAAMLVLTYVVSLALFALFCVLAPRQEVVVTGEGIVTRSGRKESFLSWFDIEKVEHSVDADGQLVIMSLFSGGRRRLVLTEGYPLDSLATAVHAAMGHSIPVSLVRPMLDLRFLSRHWPLLALTFAVVVALGLAWLPQWFG